MFGKEIKSHRIANKLTQKQLSQLTNISQQAISTWEKNVKTPTIENCVILADFYGITVDELIGHEVKKNW